MNSKYLNKSEECRIPPWTNFVPQCAHEQGASITTVGYSIGHYLAKLYVSSLQRVWIFRGHTVHGYSIPRLGACCGGRSGRSPGSISRGMRHRGFTASSIVTRNTASRENDACSESVLALSPSAGLASRSSVRVPAKLSSARREAALGTLKLWKHKNYGFQCIRCCFGTATCRTVLLTSLLNNMTLVCGTCIVNAYIDETLNLLKATVHQYMSPSVLLQHKTV